jgi:hypothetical protein
MVRWERLKSEGLEGGELVNGRSHFLLVEGRYGGVFGSGGGNGGCGGLR